MLTDEEARSALAAIYSGYGDEDTVNGIVDRLLTSGVIDRHRLAKRSPRTLRP